MIARQLDMNQSKQTPKCDKIIYKYNQKNNQILARVTERFALYFEFENNIQIMKYNFFSFCFRLLAINWNCFSIVFPLICDMEMHALYLNNYLTILTRVIHNVRDLQAQCHCE